MLDNIKGRRIEMNYELSRPVTIDKAVFGLRWFPEQTVLSPKGDLFCYVEWGYDAHFSPFFRLHSIDAGKTWLSEPAGVPRPAWSHIFPDGEHYEIDTYGFIPPDDKETSYFYGAWIKPDGKTEKRDVRICSSSLGAHTLGSMTHRYPTFPWWDIMNRVNKTDNCGESILLGGPCITSGVELSNGDLLAVGYNEGKNTPKAIAVCFKSKDRGRNWEEISVIARDDTTPEGPDEATMTQLKTGQIYAIMRTGGQFIHSWSDDEGKTWTKAELLNLAGSDVKPGIAWQSMIRTQDNALICVYGRPGKHVIYDESGTGKQWRYFIDLHKWELETQEFMGVPPDLQLKRPDLSVRYWDSSDYMSIVETARNEFLIFYDVQNFMENWNGQPFSGVRMVRLRIGK